MKIATTFRASRDIEECLLWSASNFGIPAARRYRKLLAVAIGEIANDPQLPGSKTWDDLQPGVRLYHLVHSRKRAPVDGLIVKRPRHFIAYRVSKGDTLEVLRVLHERMNIEHQDMDGA